MFERFTDRARRVVVLAQEEGRLLNHNYIGTEHLLLGIVHEGHGVGAMALQALGISLEKVRVEVEKLVGAGSVQPTGHIPFTLRAKKVLELSLREALDHGHHYIGTEHILLGLIREGEGVGAEVLVSLGASLDRVREQIGQLLSGESGEIREEIRGFDVVESVSIAGTDISEVGPLCAQCHAPLTETIACRELEAAVDESEGARPAPAQPALVVYCSRCGTTLGVLPPPPV